MPLTVTWRGPAGYPVEAEILRPDSLAGIGPSEAAKLPVLVGNRMAELGELAALSGDPSEGHLIVEGDLRSVARVGQGMASGRLEVRGDVGPHFAAAMSGGVAEVSGSAGDWAGAEMRGGLLRIRGDAGDGLGAAYPGSRLGMREGVILVEGGAGHDAALAMRRGLIAVGGALGDCAGRGMVAGSLFAFGQVGIGAGSGMKRGTLALFGHDRPELLPTFALSGPDRPPFVAIYLASLQARGFPVPTEAFAAGFERYNGDLAAGGQGEILACTPG